MNGNITRANIPVLMTTAEWDNSRYTKAYAGLFHELVTKHGATPRICRAGAQPLVAAVVGRHGGPQRLRHHRRLHRAHGQPLAVASAGVYHTRVGL